jgi:aerobic carbon-monoxide dehydrogenase medium subunit
MENFEYYAPGSLEDALRLLDGHQGETRILAGGTDLVVQMKYGRTNPAVVVDVKKIPDLNRLEWSDEGGLFIGAAVPVRQIVDFGPVLSNYRILHQACSLIGSFQLRSRATVGGNICNGAPSADSAPPLLCLDAVVTAAGRGGVRSIPIGEFFAGPGKTALATNEIAVGIRVPFPPKDSFGHYQRHIPRQDMDIAVVGVGAFLGFQPDDSPCLDARIALGAVAPTPIRVPVAESLLKGKDLAESLIEEAARLASEECRPITDIRGSAGYRKEIVKVLVRRALTEVWHASGRRQVGKGKE